MNIYLNCGPVRSTFTLKLQYQDQSVCRTKLFFFVFMGVFFSNIFPVASVHTFLFDFFCENLTALVKKKCFGLAGMHERALQEYVLFFRLFKLRCALYVFMYTTCLHPDLTPPDPPAHRSGASPPELN